MPIPPPAFLAASDPSVILPLLIVFGAAKLLGEIAEKLRQPPVVGELAAGILIGPAVFAWVQPNDILSFLAELGVLFLMFQVGLELRDFGLRKLGVTSLLVALGGVVLPFGVGYLLSRSFGYEGVAASFIGSALVATSVGITARVLAAQGWLDEPASKIILAAAIIDDVLGLLVLSAVSAQARGGANATELLVACGLAIGFTIIVATWGQRTVVRVAPQLEARMSGSWPFSLAVILLFSLSFAAVHVGVAAIIGAFLAGMALANSADQKVHSMVHGVTELLVPFFLAGIGLHLDGSLFGKSDLWLFMGLLTLVACATKFIGCGLPAVRLGWSEAAKVGVGMMPRGEVGMVVAQVGLGLHVISPDIYGSVVVMAVATTIIAPPLLRFVYRGESQAGQAFQLPRVG
ncbi:MAG: cation:proton antiporter [Bryobacteraceae bacterium]